MEFLNYLSAASPDPQWSCASRVVLAEVIPVLTGAAAPGHNVLVASCLKFVTTFRQQIPAATMLPLVGAAAQKLSRTHPECSGGCWSSVLS